MATANYYAWERDGRPITPARPIRETVGRLKLAYPRAAHLFSWYADDDHYMADFPQDHTPFSETPWPIEPNPYPYVFATDVMHRPDLGVDCNVLFAYWIAEAKAGRMPWLKYLIWQGRRYDVRNNWAPATASGHFDHIHKSTRTDHRDTTLGTWRLTPGDDMALTSEQLERLAREVHDLWYLHFELDSAPRPPMSVAGKIETIRQTVTAGVPIPGEVTLSSESLDSIEERVDKQLDQLAD